LSFYCSFFGFAAFCAFCWPRGFFLLLDNLLELFLAFDLLAVLHWVLNSKFKLCTFFVVNGLTKGEIEKLSGQYLGLNYDESLTCKGLNLNPGHFGGFTFTYYLCLCEESCFLVSWCAVDRCDMAGSDEDHGKSRRPGVDDWGWSHRSGSWWPDDREVG
jgi:hypothetical protein